MANEKVTYEIRLKDLMSKTLRGLSKRVRKFAQTVRAGMVKALKMAGRAMKNAALAATAAGAAIGFAAVRMGQSFLEAASNLEDTQAKFATVFQGIEDEALGMVESISEGLKLGQGSVMGFMSTFQDTLVPMGFAREEAAGMSAGLTALAADLAAFNPGVRDTEDAIQAMQSVMVGMNRSALRFAVVINEDKIAQEALALGLTNANGELTEQEKVIARLSILMKGTQDAQGAFLRMQDSLTVQTIQFNEAVTDLQEEMGGRLKVALSETIKDIGGIDVVIGAVRIGFEFFTEVLTQVVIPTIANLLTNFAKFVQGMGGVDATVFAVAGTVTLLGKAFKLMWNTVKLVLYLFEQGLDAVFFSIKSMWSALKLLLGVLGFNFVSVVRLAVEAVGLWYQALDAVVIFIKDTAISVFQALINTVADVVDSIGDALVALGEYAIVPEFVRDAGKAAQEASIGMREFSASTEDLKGGSTWIGQMGEALDAFGDKLGPVQSELRTFIADTFTEMTGNVTEFVDAIVEDVPAINDIFAAVREGAAGVRTDYAALTQQVNEALEQMGTIELTSPEEVDAAAKLTAHLEMLKGIVGELPQGMNDTAESINGMTAGVESFMERIPGMQESLAGITEGALTSFGNGLTDAFVSIIDGSKSASEAFRDFASKFLIDIGTMILQAIVFGAIKSAFGLSGLANGGTVEGGVGEMTPLANGGIVSGGLGRALPVKGYANGGPIVNKPHVALIGEGKYNEAVVPLPDGRSIPVEMQGGGGANVTVEINAVDARSVDMLFRERKDTLTDIIRNAISQSRQFRSAVGGA
jgi:hypothetical protein